MPTVKPKQNTYEYRTRKPTKVIERKPKPEPEDFERYADIITAYRDLLHMTALDDDIHVGRHGKCIVPDDRGKLLLWVQSPKNLDLVAESFRRTCSGYVSTGRLFAINSGPFYMDWLAIESMMKTAHTVLDSVYAFMEIGGRGKLSNEVEGILRTIKDLEEVQNSIALSDMLGSLPTIEERTGEI